jgi:hypothetical protein
MPNMNSLHRRLDRLDIDGGPSIAESLDRALRAHEARQIAWTASGHVGAPPHKQLPAFFAEASRADREMWRKIAEGSARVIFGKDPTACSFATLQAAYALDDDALLAAINSHPLYAGWPEYDNKPDAAER